MKMTKNIGKGLFGLVMLAMVPFTAIADLKIGVVDMRSVIASSPQAKATMEKMKTEFKPREDKIIALEKELKDKTEKLQRNGAIMGEAEKSKLEKDIIAQQRELQRQQNNFREDATMRQQEEMKKIVEKINAQINSIAKNEKYDLILHIDAVPYSSQHVNITEKVIKALG